MKLNKKSISIKDEGGKVVGIAGVLGIGLLTIQILNLQGDLSESIDYGQQMNDKVQLTKTELQALQKEHNELNAAFDNMALSNQKYEEKVEALNENINTLNDEMKEKENEINSLNKELKTLEEKRHVETDSGTKEKEVTKNEVSKDSKPNSNDTKNDTLKMEATFYTAFCETGCIGVTKNGTDVSSTIYKNEKRIIAVDPNVIPLGSTVNVSFSDGSSFIAVADDTGGDIKGNRIDILVGTKEEAVKRGRQAVEVSILN